MRAEAGEKSGSDAEDADGDVAKTRREAAKAHGLSDREYEIIELIAQGFDNKMIAAELFIGEGTCLLYTSLEGSFERDNLSIDVTAEGAAAGHTRFTATVRFAPTLFGLGLKSSVFGIALPVLEHSVSLTVDTYKPGVLL